MIADDTSLAPCGACPRFVAAAQLCLCDDELGPFCPPCCRDWHRNDRADWRGDAA